ncbi:MAG: hypothetical protein KH846_08100 [Leptotrichia wadei]|mgnify:FL=1|uniref:hypothetical protein n=1 Tax=Leptotrichia wadei TaxID=157687 RepID=UPI0026F2F3F5|nr:hypothetical protein [Leptotrichia wadei]MBS6020136.1 hypothetical protein [Leptotrichia wadei]
MTETLKDTDLMTLISIAQKDESKTIEIKKNIINTIQDLNTSINTKQKKLDELDRKSMKIKFEMDLAKQTKEMYQNALKNFFK